MNNKAHLFYNSDITLYFSIGEGVRIREFFLRAIRWNVKVMKNYITGLENLICFKNVQKILGQNLKKKNRKFKIYCQKSNIKA